MKVVFFLDTSSLLTIRAEAKIAANPLEDRQDSRGK